MKVLVIGAGSIGNRHINNLNSLGIADIDVADLNRASLENAQKCYSIRRTYTDYRAAIAENDYDAALVLTPPALHVPIATELARKGIDLFIEKPLSNGLDGIDELISVKEQKKLVVMVGYNQRFNQCLAEMKKRIDGGLLGRVYYIRAEVGQYLPDWRPKIDYRKNYTAIKRLGGGIILDGTHEIDYLLWLAGGKVSDVLSTYDTLSSLEIDVEDFAEAIIRFDNRVIGSVHLNMIERGYNRYCKVMGEKGSLKWLFRDNALEHYDGESGKTTVEKFNLDPNHSYVGELKHFLQCIEDRSEPSSNLYSARQVMETVQRIKTGGQ